MHGSNQTQHCNGSPTPVAKWRAGREFEVKETFRMSNPYDPNNPNNPHDPLNQGEMIDDLMLRDDEDEAGHTHADRERVSSSVRDIASRIPESLSSIGRDISRTIERAMSAKDDYVVAVKVSHEAQEKLENLVQAGVFRSRAEAAAFLIDEGIKSQTPLFDRVQQKLHEIERLRAELRGMINTPPQP
ncbi:MAG: hypothetical protein QOG71_1199 [Pyrinomonadaceae bacterium]|nr:hypothetical protein [Pyrinomonadaceae bacterium]